MSRIGQSGFATRKCLPVEYRVRIKQFLLSSSHFYLKNLKKVSNKMSPYHILFTTLAILLSIWTSVDSVAVMSIDLGSEWMKIGIVSPGVPMEIVLNKESKRKTPAIVSYRDDVRTFGEDAQTIAIRFPKNSYAYLLDLLAKDINSPIVKLYQKRFPHYDIVEDPERHTVVFKHDGGDTLYTPEELIAQLLHRAREFAEISAAQPINECVLTVPGFFNQAERKALLQAAHLAGLKVLQLINDYTAVALNYGIFRRKDFNETSQYVMFYDMGASKTTATIVSYQITKTKERGIVETHPQISILGVGYDRTLGGLDIQLRLRDYLAAKFNEMKKTPNDVFENPRAMAKLFKEAGRLKNVLSANIEHVAQVEGLLDEHDFRLQVNREELESLCEDLFARVGAPVEQALKTAHLTMDVISQVVLVGAGTRVPRIQDELHKVVGMELSKNLNTDEAATMGAVYKAADLSTGFKVKKVITKDAVLFPIQVVFERLDNEAAGGTPKQVRRMLFGLMNPYPQKKIITFNRHTSDFSFNVNYAELDYLPAAEILNIGSQNLSQISLEGVKDALEDNRGENVESKGIKTHFSMDESGILSLAGVDFVFEKTVAADEVPEESPLSKLGNTISKLFTSGNSAEEEPAKKPVEEASEKAAEGDEKTQNKTDDNTAANTSETKNATSTESKDNKPKIVTVKAPLQNKETVLSIQQMTQKQLDTSADKLEALNEVDRARTRRETAQNNLESFVIDALAKLQTDEFASAGTAEEIDKIRTTCSQLSDWLYEDGFDADATTYEKKIGELKALTKDLYSRVFEHRERPEARKALEQMLAGATSFLNSAKNLTKTTNPEKDVFTEIEIETLSKVIRETTEWKDKSTQEQNKLKKYEPVTMTVKLMSEKMALLDREVKYLVNKLKIWRPKKTEIPVKEEPATKQDNDTKKKEETKLDDEEEEVVMKKPETNEEAEKVEEIPDEHDEENHNEL
ncbi:uncharacterized protein CBL_10660 [Carabus blaptoides fortunei]